jgi:hypothetical protein
VSSAFFSLMPSSVSSRFSDALSSASIRTRVSRASVRPRGWGFEMSPWNALRQLWPGRGFLTLASSPSISVTGLPLDLLARAACLAMGSRMEYPPRLRP